MTKMYLDDVDFEIVMNFPQIAVAQSFDQFNAQIFKRYYFYSSDQQIIAIEN